MDLFETILLNIIFISFPLVFCLLYQSYNQVFNQEKNNLILDIAILSSFYLILRFGLKISVQPPQLLFNIPLIIAYVKKRKIDTILLSICSIIYYRGHFQIFFPFLLIEYSIYFGIGEIYCFKNWKPNHLIHILLILKGICYSVMILPYQQNGLVNSIIILSSFAIITKFTIYLFERAKEVLSLHSKLKEFEKEKQLRESLFKITHEIKNPIAVCKGYLDMFDVEKLEHSRKYVPILKEEIQRLLVLLEDFLSINKIKIEKEIMDVNVLLENIHNNFLPILEDKKIETVFLLEEEEELFMWGDYNRLSQVLVNIMKNSIESIPDQAQGKIAVKLEENQNNLKIIIEDNGSGMTAEELAKIKQPFFTTKERGTGLGIYLSDEIIKEHNGTIEYNSKKGIGTTVTLTFPRNQIEFELS